MTMTAPRATALTAVVSKATKSPNCEHAQLYRDGHHQGYLKVDKVFMGTVLDALEHAGFTIINT